MRLLIVTQALDLNEPVLSTYHDWVAALADRVESVEAICLKKGKYALPQNVRVNSLGKERGGQSALQYALRFLVLSWKLRNKYDVVLIHMNQEYVLISGWLWKLLRKRIYLWRNHYAGSVLTDVAAMFCTKIFITSVHSYTARYRKAVRMPVGVNFDRFERATGVRRTSRSILFFARMSPSKRPELLIDALVLLKAMKVPFTASFYGNPLPEDALYYESLRASILEKGLEGSVKFFPGVVNEEAPEIFQAHQIFVNCSKSGMFDKMLFEAAAAGCVVLAVSEDFAAQAGGKYRFDPTPPKLAEALERMLGLSLEERNRSVQELKQFSRTQSLPDLTMRLVEEMH